MITCVLGLTACKSSEEVSEYQQQKLEQAKAIAEYTYIPMLTEFLDDELLDYYSQYTQEELEYIFENSELMMDGYGFISAAESFNLNGKATGALTVKEGEPIEVNVDGSKLVVHVELAGEKKDAQAELILSNDMFLALKGGALNPSSSFGELMERAALNTLLGMGTVFAVLILISFLIACFCLIPKIQAAMKNKKAQGNAEGIDNAVAQIAKQEESLENNDDLELAAVIAAAIASYEGAASTDGYVVRSIRKINR